MSKQQSELHGNMQRAAEMTVPLGSKNCTKCGIEKVLSDFNKCKPNKDGLMTWCRECQRENKKKWDAQNVEHRAKYKLEYNTAHREEARLYTENYRKENAEKVKEYDRNRKKTDRYKQQNAKYHAKNYLANKPKIIRQVTAYSAANPDRVRHYRLKNKAVRRAAFEAVNDLTMIQWMECKLYFDYQCAYCGAEPEVLEQDHVIAMTKGGGHTKFNIVPACRACNNSKNNSEMETWYRKQAHFSNERLERILSYTSQR